MKITVEIRVRAERRDYDVAVNLDVMYVDGLSLRQYGIEAKEMAVKNTEATLTAALESVLPAIEQCVHYDKVKR